MKCPYCLGEVEFEPYVMYNVEVYGKPLVGKTRCCGKGLMVGRKISFVVQALSEYDTRTKDDWGEDIKN